MPNLIVAPELPVLLTEQRGILTVEAEEATVSCNCPKKRPCRGLNVAEFPLADRTLQQHVYQMGHRFLGQLASRGYELVGTMTLHGPFPSYNFNETLVDVDSSVWHEAIAEQDLSKTLQFVGEKRQVNLVDYVLVGNFLKQAVLTEVIVPDKTEDDNGAAGNSTAS